MIYYFFFSSIRVRDLLFIFFIFFVSAALIDRGWRRSGCYLYKHEMDKTCCPSYTIRLKASDFAPSKEQQRVSRRLERCVCINQYMKVIVLLVVNVIG